MLYSGYNFDQCISRIQRNSKQDSKFDFQIDTNCISWVPHWNNLKFNAKRSANQSSESSIKCKSPVHGIIEITFFSWNNKKSIFRVKSKVFNPVKEYGPYYMESFLYPGSSIKPFRQIIKPRKIRRNQFTLQLNEKSDQDSNFGPIQRQVRPKLKKWGIYMADQLWTIIYG